MNQITPSIIRVIDLETTGLTTDEGICELAAVDIHAGRICVPISYLINPGRKIPAEVSAIHHITDDMVASAPMFKTAWQSLPVQDRVAVYAAHNAAYDRRYIGPEMTGGKPWICTMKCAKKAWPDAPKYGNQVLRYWLELKLQNDYANMSHRAGPDAYVTAHILTRLLREHKVAQLIEWTGAAAEFPVCPIGKHKGQSWETVPMDFLAWMVRQEGMEPDLKARAQRALNER